MLLKIQNNGEKMEGSPQILFLSFGYRKRGLNFFANWTVEKLLPRTRANYIGANFLGVKHYVGLKKTFYIRY